MFHQLVYSSLASEAMPKSKLYKILLEARANNARHDVTGLLVFVDNVFLQVLEGERDVVVPLMKKISGDKRHGHVSVLWEADVAQRSFPHWKMAYVTPSGRDLATWAGLKNTTTLDDTLATLRAEPGRVPEILINLIDSVKDGDLLP